MVSFLKRLFGGSAGSSKDGGLANFGDPVSYKDVVIKPAPMKRDGQWLLAGVIVKNTGEAEIERTFIRADTFSSRDEAEASAIRKGKQIIDEQGDRLFADGEATRNV